MNIRFALAAALGATLALGAAAAGHAAPPAKKRLLVITHTGGFRHDEGIAAGVKALQEIGEKSGVFTFDRADTAEEVQKMTTPEALKAYDGVVFLNTTGDIGIPDLPAFLEWVRSGKAVIGMHAATDTYHDRPAFIEMMGGEFETHGRQTKVQPIIVDPKHPANKDWKPGFEIFDEIYHTKSFDPAKVHVLLKLDKVPDDGTATANQPADFPLAWCKLYGKGRVFYTAFGHRGDVWEREDYRMHLLGGIKWALGLAKGEPTPKRGAR
jgi:type 1 glutamine amidotransferase